MKSISLLSLIPVLIGTIGLHGQNIHVKGKVSASGEPAKFALITFIDQNDTTRKFAVITDTSGNYNLDIITSIKPEENIPQKFKLEQNYPNPFAEQTSIPYKLNKQSNVSVKIFNILGQLVKEFNIGTQTIGLHGVIWDGKNNFGQKVTPGVYFYQLTSGIESQTKKMLFGFGNSSRGYQLMGPLNKSVGDIVSFSQQSTTFKIVIENLGNTRPKILSKEISNILIEKDTILNFEVELGITAYSICYQRQDSIDYNGQYPYLAWSIHLNNSTTNKHKTIINRPMGTEYPSWSPDGKYIAFVHNAGNRDLYMYDTYNDTILRLTNSGSINTSPPLWTHDSKKILYEYWRIGVGAEPHIINIEGTNDLKLKVNPSVNNVNLLFNDNYTCLFANDNKLYKSNLDSTFSEFIMDLRSTTEEYYTIRDFNPITEKLLINTNSIPGKGSSIIEFDVNTKQIEVLITPEEGYDFASPRYSKDYSKIAFHEANIEKKEEYLSLFENGIKTRLLKLTGLLANEWLDYRPWQFSPDGKFIAFSINVTQDGPGFWWISYLYIIELSTKELTLIDIGVGPQWNPIYHTKN